MASYGAYILDNGDGTFSLSVLMRAPTVHTITGGTDLTTQAWDGVVDQPANTTGSVINGQSFSPQDVFRQAMQVVADDRSLNG